MADDIVKRAPFGFESGGARFIKRGLRGHQIGARSAERGRKDGSVSLRFGFQPRRSGRKPFPITAPLVNLALQRFGIDLNQGLP